MNAQSAEAALAAELREADSKATSGPWEHGDRQTVAGVWVDGTCAYCSSPDFDLTWSGTRDINGRRMAAHVHTAAEPWWDHGIYAVRPEGSVVVVNDTDEYGCMDDGNADLVVLLRNNLPVIIAALERVTKARQAGRDEVIAAVDALAAELREVDGDGRRSAGLRVAVAPFRASGDLA